MCRLGYTSLVIRSLSWQVNDADIPDMADFEVDDAATAAEADEAALPYFKVTEPEDPIMRTRTYDLSISYDKYYQVSSCCAGFRTRSSPELTHSPPTRPV